MVGIALTGKAIHLPNGSNVHKIPEFRLYNKYIYITIISTTLGSHRTKLNKKKRNFSRGL